MWRGGAGDITGQGEAGLYVQGDRLAQEMGIVTDVRLGNKPSNTLKRRTRVLILGVNGLLVII